MTKQRIGLIVGIVVAIVIALIPPMEPLTSKSMLAVGIMLGAILWISFDTFPDYVAILTMCILWVMLKISPFSRVFLPFSETTFWLVLGAMGIAAGAATSGLLLRVSLYMMKTFAPTYKGQNTAITLAALIIGPFIPAMAAKASILGPIVRQISDSLGFEPNSKGAAGLFGAYYSSVACAAPIFLSSSVIGYTAIALMPEAKYQITWFSFFLYALPWGIVCIGLMYLASLWMYKPETEKTFSKAEIEARYDALGPMKRNEKTAMIILCFCLLLWMTEPWVKIPSAIVAMAGWVLMLVLKVYGRNELRNNISWESAIFVGAILALVPVLTDLKVNEFIKVVLAPMIIPLMKNFWIFVPVFVAFNFVVRLIICSMVGSISIVTLVLIPFALEMNIHPFVIAFMCYTVCASFNAIYQVSSYVAARAAVGGDEMVKHGAMIKYSFVFNITCILGNMACIPWWKMLGLIP